MHLYLPRYAAPGRPECFVPPSPPAEARARWRRQMRRETDTYTGRLHHDLRLYLPGSPEYNEVRQAMRIGTPGAMTGGMGVLNGIAPQLYGNANPLSSLTDAAVYWKGEDATDATGHGNTLTEVNSPSYSTGKVGNALYAFEDPTNKYWTAADSSYLQMGTNVNFTIALWAFCQNNGFAVFLDRGTYLSTDTFNIRLDVSQHVIGAWGNSGAGANLNSANTSSTFSSGAWHHIMMLIQPGATSNGNAWLYLDNTLVDSQINANIISAGADSLTTYVGTRQPGMSGGAGTVRLDEIGIWKRIITSTERGLLYNSGNGATAFP